MAKKIIAVDADDTIFDENTAVRLFMNRTYGFKHIEADYLVEGSFETYWENIWKVSPEKTLEMYEQFVTSPDKHQLRPVGGATNALRQLKEKYQLVIVTSRDGRAVGLTRHSLDKYYPNVFSNVYFTPLWGDGEKATKAMVCAEIGASYLIDDSFEHCQLAAKAGIEALLFGDYGWNRHQPLPAHITRCKNWDAVLRCLI